MTTLGCFIIFLLVTALSTSVAANNYYSVLQEADALKLSDRPKFNALLDKVKTDYENLTNDEQDYLSYLSAYAISISGNFDSAIIELEKLAKTGRSALIRFRAKATLVNLYVLTKNYTEAFAFSEEVLRDISDISDKAAIEQAFRITAMLHSGIKNYSNALYYAEQVIEISSDDVSRCAAWQLKIEALFYLQQSRHFTDALDEALITCKQSQERLFESIIISFHARHLHNSGETGAALEVLEKNYGMASSTNWPLLISGFNALLAKYSYETGRLKQAETYALKALETGLKDQFTEAMAWTFNILYKIERSKGNYSQALQFYEQFHLQEKGYLNQLSAQQLAYHQARSEVEVKNQRIALLNKDNELLHLQKSVYEQEVENNRLIMILLTLVLLAASALAYKGLRGRKHFKMMAQFDQLTGISNRYHFNQMAEVALEYCEKNAKPAALILFDLDHFKTINDEFGHAAGDWALHQVVKICRNFMRNNDVFGRIGGEEFAVVLPGCHADKALLLADICRDAIAEIDSTPSGHSFTLSASFGVSSSDTSGFQLKQLLADADKAMYQAKGSGRDQVKAFGYD